MWNNKCQEAFGELKQQLTNAPVLYHYQLELETQLETDASDGVVAGVLTGNCGMCAMADELARDTYITVYENKIEYNYAYLQTPGHTIFSKVNRIRSDCPIRLVRRFSLFFSVRVCSLFSLCSDWCSFISSKCPSTMVVCHLLFCVG